MEFPGVLKKDHAEILRVKKQRSGVSRRGDHEKNNVEFSFMGFVFWPWSFQRLQYNFVEFRKQPLWTILWNKCSWKLGVILTKACKGIQYLGKMYTAVIKPLPWKWVPLQVPLTKISNFSNNYMIVYIFSCCFSYFTCYMLWGDYLKTLSFIEKVLQGLTMKNFRTHLKKLLNGCFSNQHSKKILCSYFLKNGITKK